MNTAGFVYSEAILQRSCTSLPLRNMDLEQNITPISSFEFEGKAQPVTLVNKIQITEGVECDAYSFIDDKEKDLGIIRIKPGAKTPQQKVLAGEKTIEGYVSGKGKLTLKRADGPEAIYWVGGEETKGPFSVPVNVGDIMQWEAAPDSQLVAYEICFPPYKDGRFENIE